MRERSDKIAYNIQEAAAAVGCSADTLRAHIKAGYLIARYPTSRPVIVREELIAWLSSLPSEPKGGHGPVSL
ncbi:helix-turn-helix domain-containing protein [Arthrobacter sp. 260]|nr:helix-turn-helix domain-containing protein [Arthrobacter sp. 260]